MYIRVKVEPGAKQEFIKQLNETSFEVAVKEPPINNLANRRVLVVVSTFFNLPENKVRIISGHHGRTKIINLDI